MLPNEDVKGMDFKFTHIISSLSWLISQMMRWWRSSWEVSQGVEVIIIEEAWNLKTLKLEYILRNY